MQTRYRSRPISFRAGLGLLDTVTALSDEDCVLIFDTLARRVPPGSGAGGPEARFCPDDVGALLRDRGWAVRTQETVAAPARAYGRAAAEPAATGTGVATCHCSDTGPRTGEHDLTYGTPLQRATDDCFTSCPRI